MFNGFELVAEFKAGKSALNLLYENVDISAVLAGLKVGLYDFMEKNLRCPSNDEFFNLIFKECQHPRMVDNSTMTTTTTTNNGQQTDDCTSECSTILVRSNL